MQKVLLRAGAIGGYGTLAADAYGFGGCGIQHPFGLI